jgi:hypothetical protein
MTHVEQTSVHPGKTGAKRQSWRQDNPRSMLLKIIAENPHETQQDEDAILELLWEEVKKNQDTLKTICLYWGTNNYRSIVYAERPSMSRADVDFAKQTIVKRLMVLVMPNGKALKDCNKQDCLKAGGWLTAVGKKLKPGQTVGQVFTEEDLKKILNPPK